MLISSLLSILITYKMKDMTQQLANLYFATFQSILLKNKHEVESTFSNTTYNI